MIRMLNAGALNHPFHPHGNHTSEIAQDGRLLGGTGPSASTEHFGETIGAGQTQDFLLRWDQVDLWNPNSDQLPVAQPNYRNLTFKGGNTFYSGNPYLGYSGTLPTGTTSQNICGEWYFPLHSHALDEFSNYDAGFGGMGTLLRVDPLGGCFTFPAATKIIARNLNGGAVANLALDDAKYYKVNSSTTGIRTTNWYGQFSKVAAGATNLSLTYKGNNSRNGLHQTLFLWNWTTSTWVGVTGSTPVGTSPVGADFTFGPMPICDGGSLPNCVDVIGTGINNGRVRVRVLTTGNAANFVTGGNLMKITYDAP